MATIYLILGSNSGNKSSLLNLAITLLQDSLGSILFKSSVYETDAWGYESENTYLNQVVSIETNFKAIETLDTTQDIEHQLGRKNKTIDGIYTDRPIDIDILFYNQEITFLPRLKIPHPRICERRFVLTPLNEIAPQLIHPENGKSISNLLELCKDNLEVRKL